MIRKPPIERRYLGDFEITTRGGDKYTVSVCVNAEKIAQALFGRAVNSPARRAKALDGAILVEYL